jgi:hypothetical protein
MFGGCFSQIYSVPAATFCTGKRSTSRITPLSIYRPGDTYQQRPKHTKFLVGFLLGMTQIQAFFMLLFGISFSLSLS